MLDTIAPIYIKLIYEYLTPQQLGKLGETCKTIHQDTTRKEMIVQKISPIFGYRINQRFWNSEVNYDKMNPELLQSLAEVFFKTTMALQFRDIENLSFEKKRYLIITFPMELFKVLDPESQILLIHFLCDHLYLLCRYAKDKKMNMSVYEYRCPEEYDLYTHHNFIQNKLEKIFFEGSEKIRCVVIELLMVLADITKHYLFSKDKMDVENFINSLFGGDVSRLVEILDIGLFMQTHFPNFLKTYLENIFEDYLEFGKDDENLGYDYYSKELNQLLYQNNKTFPDLKNIDVLNDLAQSCHYFEMSEIQKINQKRMRRFGSDEL